MMAFFVGNSIAIRRLLDRGPSTGPRGVNSLYGLVREINNHADLLTQANTLLARGLKYDFEPIKQRAFDAATSKTSSYAVSREGWFEAEFWHKAMDHPRDVPEEKAGAIVSGRANDAMMPRPCDIRASQFGRSEKVQRKKSLDAGISFGGFEAADLELKAVVARRKRVGYV